MMPSIQIKKRQMRASCSSALRFIKTVKNMDVFAGDYTDVFTAILIKHRTD